MFLFVRLIMLFHVIFNILSGQKRRDGLKFLTGNRPKYKYLVLLCGTKFLREFIFADWRFSLFCGNNFLVIRTDWFFMPGINFCYFQKVPDKSLIIFSVLLSTCNGNIYFKTTAWCAYPCKTSKTNYFF